MAAAFSIPSAVSIIAHSGVSPVIAATASRSSGRLTLGTSTASARSPRPAAKVASSRPHSVSKPLMRTIRARPP